MESGNLKLHEFNPSTYAKTMSLPTVDDVEGFNLQTGMPVGDQSSTAPPVSVNETQRGDSAATDWINPNIVQPAAGGTDSINSIPEFKNLTSGQLNTLGFFGLTPKSLQSTAVSISQIPHMDPKATALNAAINITPETKAAYMISSGRANQAIARLLDNPSILSSSASALQLMNLYNVINNVSWESLQNVPETAVNKLNSFFTGLAEVIQDPLGSASKFLEMAGNNLEFGTYTPMLDRIDIDGVEHVFALDARTRKLVEPDVISNLVGQNPIGASFKLLSGVANFLSGKLSYNGLNTAEQNQENYNLVKASQNSWVGRLNDVNENRTVNRYVGGMDRVTELHTEERGVDSDNIAVYSTGHNSLVSVKNLEVDVDSPVASDQPASVVANLMINHEVYDALGRDWRALDEAIIRSHNYTPAELDAISGRVNGIISKERIDNLQTEERNFNNAYNIWTGAETAYAGMGPNALATDLSITDKRDFLQEVVDHLFGESGPKSARTVYYRTAFDDRDEEGRRIASDNSFKRALGVVEALGFMDHKGKYDLHGLRRYVNTGILSTNAAARIQAQAKYGGSADRENQRIADVADSHFGYDSGGYNSANPSERALDVATYVMSMTGKNTFMGTPEERQLAYWYEGGQNEAPPSLDDDEEGPEIADDVGGYQATGKYAGMPTDEAQALMERDHQKMLADMAAYEAGMAQREQDWTDQNWGPTFSAGESDPGGLKGFDMGDMSW
tara:strand:- start:571 stop:2769 length:2199 start_codon:yes stop_codon:yes gene_type:complete